MTHESPELEFDRQVFLNFPYDDEYRKLFHALVFVVIRCGLQPRFADELKTGSNHRLTRIRDRMDECRFSIHDVSLSKNHPRLNMPLELGIWFEKEERFAKRSQEANSSERMRNLILEGEPGECMVAFTDIQGHDPQPHHNDPEMLIEIVRRWFQACGLRKLPSNKVLMREFGEFMEELPMRCAIKKQELEKLTHHDYEEILLEWLSS